MDCIERIDLCGEVRFVCRGETHQLPLRKSAAILTILALSPGRRARRDTMLGLLWSDREEATARNALRQALHRLRRELENGGASLVETEAEAVALAPVEIDALAALAEAEAGRPPKLLLSWPTALLEIAAGLDTVDSAFSNWLNVKRQRLNEDAVTLLAAALEGDGPEGREIARLLLRIEPTQEAACRHLMREAQRRGAPAEALSIYNDLWARLEEDFDCQPSEETQRLVVEIKQGADPVDPEPAPAPVTASRASGDPPLLWVEPFASGDLGQSARLRVEGLRSDLIATFGRFREVRVIDGAWARRAAADASAGLFTLNGVTFAGSGKVEVVINVVEAGSGRLIWSDRTFLGRDQVPAERRTARRVAAALSLHLSSSRLRPSDQDIDPALPAYDIWRYAQSLLGEWRPESEDRAEAIFRDLIASSPNFAPAKVGLANVLNSRHLIRPGIERRREDHAESRQLCLVAVRLDPLDARAQLALGWSLALNADWHEAIEAVRLAWDLNPNDPWVLASASLSLAFCGQVDEGSALATEMARIPIGLTPLHWAYLASVRYLAGDHDASAWAAERGAGATFYIGGWHAAALAQSGNRRAGAALDRFLRSTRANWHGAEPPTDAAITAWLLHAHPIRDASARDALALGLERAGAPIPAAYGA